MLRCPGCGHELFLTATADKLRLTPREAQVFNILSKCAPQYVTTETLVTRVFGYKELEDPTKNMHVIMHRIRGKLARSGLDLTISSKHYDGYRLG